MATLFRFSEAASLALHTMVFVACRDGEPVNVRELATRFRASSAHTSKVCQRLARAGLLIARRGAGGGFLLGRRPGTIRLIEVYSAIEGPVRLTACLFQDRSCRTPPAHDCILGHQILRLETQFLDYLRSTRLSSIAAVSDLRRAP